MRYTKLAQEVIILVEIKEAEVEAVIFNEGVIFRWNKENRNLHRKHISKKIL